MDYASFNLTSKKRFRWNFLPSYLFRLIAVTFYIFAIFTFLFVTKYIIRSIVYEQCIQYFLSLEKFVQLYLNQSIKIKQF